MLGLDRISAGGDDVALTMWILAGMAAMGLYVFLAEPLWVLDGLERLTPNIVYRVRTEAPLVGLSFDDGPHAKFTPQVLDVLKRHGAKATFFLIGERAGREPELVARIRAAGHETGNHYFENGTTLLHSSAKFVKKLEETEREIGLGAVLNSPDDTKRMESRWTLDKSGHPANDDPKALFRPPGGVAWPRQLRLARERGYRCVLGCAYPHDPARPPVAYMRWLIKKNLLPGTIVILHDGIADATRSIAVLPQILEEGKQRGLKFVSIGELLKAMRPELKKTTG